MILTVTLNPALDRTINIKGFTKGRKNSLSFDETVSLTMKACSIPTVL